MATDLKNTIPGTIDKKQYRAVLQRFQLINQERLRRASRGLASHQLKVLELIPFLLHENDENLPGFVNQETPAGLSNYMPSSQVIKTANASWPDFKYKKRARLRYDLHGLYMMGSVGSIAQSRASDFDYWLCHRPGLSDEELGALEQKSLAITSWAEEVNLEVHFFLMDAAAFKDGEVLNLSEHSSGSAQYHLLLDEFYRTSVLVAGRSPAWWYVPSEHEAHFDKYLEKIEQLKLASRAEMVDFGHIAEIPAEEFFGAALWQLYKAIDSPFKSVLKILVMEAYASQYPHIQPLSLGFKQLVFESQASLDELDPYLMLYRFVEEYLTEKGQFSRLDLVRRCFYLKLNIPLSQPSRLQNWRREILTNVVSEWGWSKATLQDLDNRKHWKIDRVLRETRFLVRELIQSYQFLSEFAKDKSALINAEDLNTLGRKLYAAFERKAGKIELINPGIAPNLLEDELTVLETKMQDNRSVWSLYRGKVPPKEAPSWHPLKRTRTLIELLTWGYLNTLIDTNTHLLVYADNTNVHTRELHDLIHSLQETFPNRSEYGKHQVDFSVPAKPIEFAVFVNIGVEPLEKLKRQGKQMTSNKTDALSYSGLNENLIHIIDQIELNSWHEFTCSHYGSEEALIECLCHYISAALENPQSLPTYKIYCHVPTRGKSIADRLQQLFDTIQQVFLHSRGNLNSRFIVQVGRKTYMIHLKERVPTGVRIEGRNALLSELQMGREDFSPIAFDQYALGKDVLKYICKFNTAGIIQYFYEELPDHIEIYVLDEKGVLFHQFITPRPVEHLLNHYHRFFAATIHRQSMISGQKHNHQPAYKVEYFVIEDGQRYGVKQVSQRTFKLNPEPGYHHGIQVLLHLSDEGKLFPTFIWDDEEISYLDFNDSVYNEVVSRIISLRAAHATYPVCVTDIDLSQVVKSDREIHHLSTCTFLNYKRELENKLNTALLELENTS